MILAQQRLAEMGISTHTAYGIPDTTVSLLNLQGVTKSPEGLRVSVSLLFFGGQEELPVLQLHSWTNALKYPVLNQTVDSLPHFIGRIWGYEEDQPYTIVLNEKLLARREFSGPVLSVEKHDQAFIANQKTKRFVLGICSADRLVSDACSPGLATMAVGLDMPVMEGDSATVQVRIVRPRNLERPEGRSFFFAEVFLHFIRSPDGWKYTDYVLGSIT